MRTKLAAALAVGLLLGGCAGTGASRTATQETLLTATATIESVDATSREVVLRDDADGATFTVVAGPEVRNFDQLAAGDRVQMDFYQATTLSMASPDDPGNRETAVIAGRAPEGATPGAMAVVSDSLVVTLINYDRNSGIANFRTPDGFTRRAVVPPNLRSFAASLAPGARVLVTLTDATAVRIVES
jgi:hypothetical protein